MHKRLLHTINDSSPPRVLGDLVSKIKNSLFLNLFFITIVFALFVIGYRVFESDQLQYLLLPFRTIYENFCPRDWFVWETSHYHYSFSYLVQFLYYVSAGHFEIAFFIGWAAVMFGVVYGLYRLTIASGGGFAHYCAVLMMLLLYSSSSIGDSVVYTNTFIPSGIAFVLTIYACALLLEDKYVYALTVLGLAAFVHINYGVIGFPIFIMYILMTGRPLKIKEIILGSGIFFILFLPQLVPSVLSFSGDGEWLGLSYFLRSPHHYDPRVFGWFEWMETIIPTVLAVWFGIRNFENKSASCGKEYYNQIVLIGIIASLSVLVLLFNLFTDILLFYKIYIWRLAPFLLIFSYGILSRVFISPKQWNKTVITFLLFVLGMTVVLKYGAVKGIIKGAALAGGIVILRKGFISKKIAAFYSITLIVIILVTNGYKDIRIYNRIPEMEWIRNNTPETALFLTPPDLETVRISARRSIIVDLKCAPIGNGSEMHEWKKRLEAVTASPPLETIGASGYRLWDVLTDYYLQLTPEQVQSIMEQYGADYFVTYTTHRQLVAFENAGFEMLNKSNKIVVFRRKE